MIGRPIAPATPPRIREMEPRNMHATMRKMTKVKMGCMLLLPCPRLRGCAVYSPFATAMIAATPAM